MSRDIFEFWSTVPDDAFVHPADKDVVERVPSKFAKDCLPIAFVGPLRTAPIVLLFLSPRYTEFDSKHARSTAGHNHYRRQRSGRAALPSRAEHEPGYEWWSRVVRQFSVEPKSVADKVAILNIGAYHSAKFHDWHMLTALPSSRVTLDWAQFVLFPQAEAGERVVVCLRSSRLWGLSKGERYGMSLFVPPCTPSGIMHHVPMRKIVTTAVQAKLGDGQFSN